MNNMMVINILPAKQEFETMKEMAQLAVKSGLLPTSVNTNEKAVIIMLKGRELGIPPMQAFSHINVINGKPTMSAELMLAQIYKCIPRVVINFTSTTDKECIIEAKRPHGDKTKFSFTIDDARKAGLLDKGPWKTYPASMLRARAISAMARALFPDALNGVSYTPEELGADIEIDEHGEEVVRDVTPEVKKVETKPEAIIPEVVTTPKKEQPKTRTVKNHATGDDVQIGMFEKTLESNDVNKLGQFVIKVKAEAEGKKLSEVSIEYIKKLIKWLTDKANNDPKNLSALSKEFIDHANAYIEAYQKSVDDLMNTPVGIDSNDQIPF